MKSGKHQVENHSANTMQQWGKNWTFSAGLAAGGHRISALRSFGRCRLVLALVKLFKWDFPARTRKDGVDFKRARVALAGVARSLAVVLAAVERSLANVAALETLGRRVLQRTG